MKKNVVFVLSTVLLIAGGIYWIQHSSSHHEHSHGHGHHHHGHGDHDEEEPETIARLTDQQSSDLGVSTLQAAAGDLNLNLSTRGKVILHPDHLAHILPKTSGVAKEAKKNIGDPVKQGEVIAILESREMADIKAEYLAAVEYKNLAQASFERESRLREKKISSEEEYLNSKSNYEEAKINVQLAEQKLHAFGIDNAEITSICKGECHDLRFYELRAPLDGNIIKRDITQGEFIENTQTIYEIASLDPVWVDIGIYSKDLPQVKVGQTVEVTLPGQQVQGHAKIIYVSPIIQEDTIAATAIAELSNPTEEWHPGCFVSVNIKTSQISVPLMIPSDAIQTIEDQAVVFVKIPEGFEIRNVQTGRTDGKNVEILYGLGLGEEYAATNTFALKAELGKMSAEHD